MSWLATSRILIGSPMSRTSASPGRPMAPAWMTSWHASSIVMKKRVTSGSVTVTGPPAAICLAQAVRTEPREQSTLPHRTDREAPGTYVAFELGGAAGGEKGLQED